MPEIDNMMKHSILWKSNYQLAFLITILFLSTVQPGHGQDRETSRFSNRIEVLAREYYRIGDYQKALEGFLILDSLNPDNSDYNYHLGICYLNSSQKSKAYPHLEFAYHQEDAPDNILYELARAYHYGMEFEKAIIHYESYQKQIRHEINNVKPDGNEIADIALYIQQCRNGIRLARDPLLNTSVYNMGLEINSEFADFAPLIDKNESLLIFTSKRKASVNTKSDPLTGQYYENVFYSTKADGNWTKVQDIGPPINKEKVHNSAVGLSPKGDLLFLYQGDDNSLSARIAGDLLISRREGDKWGTPDEIQTINSRNWESSATLSEDESILVFSSDREGGYGGTDLYISRKQVNGEWSPPENLGAYINTPYNDDGPFLHPDGNRLYFSSQGHNSMGGYDVFYSEFLEDRDRWTRPVNLGFPINTPDNDIFFVWSADGERAYFSSQRSDTYGDTDIYILIRDDKDNILVNACGVVTDKINHLPVAAEIIVRDLWNNNLIGIFDSNNVSGVYSMELKAGRKYSVTVRAAGYTDVIQILEVPQGVNMGEVVKNVTLTRKK